MTQVTIDISVEAGIARIVLNRPQRLNAITRDMLQELHAGITALIEREDVRVAILCGAGRAFAAGVDLRELEVDEESLLHGDVGASLNDLAREVTALIEAAPFPVIAQVHGACFTGALEIALACDWIVAAESAVFGDTHAKLGLRPTWGMSVRLADAVGLRRARELSHTGRSFSGVEAGAYGLANTVVPQEELEQTVADLCQVIAENSPSSLSAYKALYLGGSDTDHRVRLDFEAEYRFPCPDAPARIEAFVTSLSRK